MPVVQFNSSAKHTITSNATGGGLLKFTSNFVITPSSGTTSGGLTLRGSGKGEVAQIGTIPGILEKADAGTWTIGGTNAANSVTVTAGTLLVNGTLNATTTASVSSGATLGGSGTIGAVTTVSGSIAPGTAVGFDTLTVTNDVTWNGGNTWKFNLDSGNNSDKLEITGVGSDFLKGTGSTWQFDFLGSSAAGTFTLATWTGTTNFVLSNFSFTGYTGVNPGSFTLNSNSLVFTAIPEPSTALGGLLLGAGLLRRRRKVA